MSECNVSTAINEDENNTKCQKINKKRRSSFFVRRSILTLPKDIDESTPACDDKEQESGATTSNGRAGKENVEREENRREEPFDIQAYIANLKQERKSWIETLAQRKRQRRSLAKQKSTSQRRERDPDLSALLESERSFLLARPNYEQICENVGKLTEMAVKTVVLHERIAKLHGRFMSRAQDKVDSLTLRLIEMSD